MLPVDESTSKRPGSAPSPAGTSPVGGVSLLEVVQGSPGLLSDAVESERQSSLYVYDAFVVAELAGGRSREAGRDVRRNDAGGPGSSAFSSLLRTRFQLLLLLLLPCEPGECSHS